MLLILVLMLANFVLFAQEEQFHFGKRILYEISYISDSTNSQSKKRENAELLINDSLSLFRTIQKAENDHEFLNPPEIPSPLVTGGASINKFNYQILKFANGLVKTYDEFAGSDLRDLEHLNYYLENLDAEHWVIEDDTLTINGFDCQKATIQYGGRTWNAWFCPEIPIFDGPYKFGGLLGLIIAIRDKGETWNFNLLAIEDFNKDVIINKKKGLKIKEIAKKDFIKQREKYQQDLLNRGISARILDPNMRNELENRIQMDNNLIEL